MSHPRQAVLRLLLGLIPLATGACTMVGGPVRPATMPGPPEPQALPSPKAAPPLETVESRATDRTTAGVVQLALESIGTPYEWGGSDANGFDCSGLIQFAYGRFGIRVPRTSTAQMRAGSSVEPEPELLRPGDVLGFSTGSGPASHVGLYIGEGEFIHSSSSGVRVSTLRSTYWQESLVAARRIVE